MYIINIIDINNKLKLPEYFVRLKKGTKKKAPI